MAKCVNFRICGTSNFHIQAVNFCTKMFTHRFSQPENCFYGEGGGGKYEKEYNLQDVSTLRLSNLHSNFNFCIQVIFTQKSKYCNQKVMSLMYTHLSNNPSLSQIILLSEKKKILHKYRSFSVTINLGRPKFGFIIKMPHVFTSNTFSPFN